MTSDRRTKEKILQAVDQSESPSDVIDALVLMNKDQSKDGLKEIQRQTGLNDKCVSLDFGKAGVNMAQANNAPIVLLKRFGIARVKVDQEQLSRLQSSQGSSGIIKVRRGGTKTVNASQNITISKDYLQGFEAGVKHAILALNGAKSVAYEDFIAYSDSQERTWGLAATKCDQSALNGDEIRVCVLDTGICQDHPDFVNRNLTAQSFILGQSVRDGHKYGHGTHVCGTVSGPLKPLKTSQRYGCAPGVDLFIGKVISNSGFGQDFDILSGIEWSIENKCRIVCMSLSGDDDDNNLFYQSVADEAIRSTPGTLLIAAAGNDSSRPDQICRSGSPANCESIISVGAVDCNLNISNFSNCGVNIVGPGSKINSSVPGSEHYGFLCGTSMATPHIVGICAQWLQKLGPDTSALELRKILFKSARALRTSSHDDVGVGLAQAPVDIHN